MDGVEAAAAGARSFLGGSTTAPDSADGCMQALEGLLRAIDSLGFLERKLDATEDNSGRLVSKEQLMLQRRAKGANPLCDALLDKAAA